MEDFAFLASLTLSAISESEHFRFHLLCGVIANKMIQLSIHMDLNFCLEIH